MHIPYSIALRPNIESTMSVQGLETKPERIKTLNIKTRLIGNLLDISTFLAVKILPSLKVTILHRAIRYGTNVIDSMRPRVVSKYIDDLIHKGTANKNAKFHLLSIVFKFSNINLLFWVNHNTRIISPLKGLSKVIYRVISISDFICLHICKIFDMAARFSIRPFLMFSFN
jgi:hypothetical protein